MQNKSPKQIFFIGTGRNGSTLISDIIASHPDLFWISNYQDRFPKQMVWSLLNRIIQKPTHNIVGATTNTKNQIDWLKRLFPRHSEAYRFWDQHLEIHFSKNFMANETATEEQKLRIRNQIDKLEHLLQKPVFFSKLTGPPRVTFLQSIFPDAFFVHIIRDFRAVTNSYLTSFFWEKGGGFETPWWNGILSEDDVEVYNQDKRPEVLAALQIKNIVKQSQSELKALPSQQWINLRYEDFLENPQKETSALLDKMGLEMKPYISDKIEEKNIYKQEADIPFRNDEGLGVILNDLLLEYNYKI